MHSTAWHVDVLNRPYLIMVPVQASHPSSVLALPNDHKQGWNFGGISFQTPGPFHRFPHVGLDHRVGRQSAFKAKGVGGGISVGISFGQEIKGLCHEFMGEVRVYGQTRRANRHMIGHGRQTAHDGA